MTLEELIAKRQELLSQVNNADAELFAKIQEEVAKIDYQIEETEKQEENERKKAKVEAETRAARTPNPKSNDDVVLFDTKESRAKTETMSKEEELRFAKIAFGKQVRSVITNTPIELSAKEKRALGVAVTTTSTTYTAPSESANGVNNGGVFIPQNVLYDLWNLKKATVLSSKMLHQKI